jgi:hypothetical protein
MRCASAPSAAAARIMIAGRDRPLIEFHIAFSLLGLRNIRIKTLYDTYVLAQRYIHHKVIPWLVRLCDERPCLKNLIPYLGD